MSVKIRGGLEAYRVLLLKYPVKANLDREIGGDKKWALECNKA